MKLILIIFILIIFQFNQLFSDILWEVDYGLMGADDCAVQPSMSLCSDGGFVIIGSLGYEYWPSGFEWIGHVIKFNNTGDIIWNSTEILGYNHLSPEGVFETSLGNYITTGKIYGPDIGYISKRDCNGDTIWVQLMEDFRFRSFIGQDEFGFLIGGMLSTTNQAALRKIDFEGNILWTRDYYLANGHSFFSSGIRTSEDNYFLEVFASISGEYESAIMKVNSNGDSLWVNFLEDEFVRCIIETSDNELVISTWTQMLKMDYDGNILNNAENSFYYAIDLPNESCFLSASYSGYDYRIDKFDYNLNHILEITDFPRFFFRLLLDNGFLFFHERSFHLIRTDENIVSAYENSIPNPQSRIFNYPNPFNPITTISFSLQNNSNIELSIYNIKGQKVKQLISDQLPSGQHSVVWDGRDENSKSVSSGIYLYKLDAFEKEITRKMLLLK